MKQRLYFNGNAILWVALSFILAARYVPALAFLYDGRIIVPLAYGATIPVVIAAARALIRREVTVDLLAGIALSASLISREWQSVLFINLMIVTARIFSLYTERRSHAAIESLLKLRPDTAMVERNGSLVTMALEDVEKGDLVHIRMGERIPVDGIIETGDATIDQSSLTGESIPVFRKAGEMALSSTILVAGNIKVRATRVGKETTLEKIVALVEESQQNKSRLHSISETFGRWYILLTLAGALVAYLAFRDLHMVLALLLVSCADDVAIAIPTAFLATISTQARHGVIVKGSIFLEGLAKAKTLIVDKTGTLTKGQLRVEKLVTFGGVQRERALELAGIGAVLSGHPSAVAIHRHAVEQGASISQPQAFTDRSGKGSIATQDGKAIISGKASFLSESGVPISEEDKKTIDGLYAQGYMVTAVAYDGVLIAACAMADELRPNIKATIQAIKKLGVRRVAMLTGDNEVVARRISQEAGIDEFYAGLLPEDKVAYVKTCIGKDGPVVMVGDGVNDAAALALADIGIAMGAIGSDVAIESADVALMRDEFEQIPELMRASKGVMRVVRQDLVVWGITNAVGILLVLLHYMGPSEAALYNLLTDFIPILNSLRLFR
jgi:heavy metal translocating P-type ATPase